MTYLQNWLISCDPPLAESVTVSDGIVGIASGAFQNMTALTSVTLPSTLTEPEFSAIHDCGNLQTIRFNDNVTQWEAIEKSTNDTADVSVICIDGTTTCRSDTLQ